MDDIKYVKNIINYISKILEYINNKTYKEFCENIEMQDACMFNLTLIGEEVVKISDKFKKDNNNIEWKEIKGMRNRIIHDYMGIDYQIIWETIKEDLPKMKDDLKKII